MQFALQLSTASPGCPAAAPAVPDPELGWAMDLHSLSPKEPKSTVPAALDRQACSETDTIYVQKALTA